MRKIIQSLLLFVALFSISSCCKDKVKDEGCKSNNLTVEPFLQRFDYYACNTSNAPFQYIFWNREQIDSLQNMCHFIGAAVYPLNHLPNLYMVTADSLFNYSDTITGEIFIDTCQKEINYNVKFEQRSKNAFPDAAIVSIFCIVENVTPDYKVNINKERILLP